MGLNVRFWLGSDGRVYSAYKKRDEDPEVTISADSILELLEHMQDQLEAEFGPDAVDGQSAIEARKFRLRESSVSPSPSNPFEDVDRVLVEIQRQEDGQWSMELVRGSRPTDFWSDLPSQLDCLEIIQDGMEHVFGEEQYPQGAPLDGTHGPQPVARRPVQAKQVQWVIMPSGPGYAAVAGDEMGLYNEDGNLIARGKVRDDGTFALTHTSDDPNAPPDGTS